MKLGCFQKEENEAEQRNKHERERGRKEKDRGRRQKKMKEMVSENRDVFPKKDE